MKVIRYLGILAFIILFTSVQPTSADDDGIVLVKEIESPPQAMLRWSSTNFLASVTYVEADWGSYIDKNTNIYDVEQDTWVAQLEELNEIGALEWNHDGNYLATTDRSYHMTIWDINTLEYERFALDETVKVHGPIQYNTSLSWHPASTFVAVNFENYLAIFYTKTGERTIIDYESTIASLEWEPSGKQLAFASGDGEILVLDGNSLITNTRLNSGMTRFIVLSDTSQQMAWSPDSTQIALFDASYADYENNVIAWSDVIFIRTVVTDNVVMLLGHQDHINAIEWSSDGKWLASGSRDKTVKIWDMDTYELAYTLEFDEIVTTLTWKPDANLLAIGTQGENIQIWEVK